MIESKVHPVVVKFRVLYEKIHAACHNRPDELVSLASTDAQIEQDCNELHSAAEWIKESQEKSGRRFAISVDPEYLEVWNDYEARYRNAISEVYFKELYSEISKILDKADLTGIGATGPRRIENPLEEAWRDADDEAGELVKSIRNALDVAADEDEYSVRKLKECKFDWRGILRRRKLVPFVNIRREVSNRYGEGEQLSLYTLLDQAQRAFVMGLFLACLALLRATIELVLHEHYGAPKKDLDLMIKEVALKLPREAGFLRLDAIRLHANAILHGNDAKLPRELEQTILEHLFVVRVLIERVPTNSVT